MNYGNIKKTDISNGEGVRVSLFVSGCRNHCPGCFNQDTWNFAFGTPFTKETEDELIADLAPDYIAGLSVLGGEPFEPENQRVLMPFLRRVRAAYPSKTIWCYTGYVYDADFLSADQSMCRADKSAGRAAGRKWCEVTDEMISLIDVLVDGPFILAQKNISLQFRGSENQRILRLNEMRKKEQSSQH
jgi:anaerobic ribonucleoside-triphosphate reductase activating protein